ncbi:MAG: hypothetical protein F4X40_08370 [Chloroflexi bacterium]|nr:hypothetical protein [Chloroflexota bacterium]
MTRHSIVVRLNAADRGRVAVTDKDSKVSNLQFISTGKRLDHGVGQILRGLMQRRLYPGETAIDLAILAATVTAADTRISREEDAQDSWTREIDLYLPVSNVDLWSSNARRIERMLRFLTGDIWRVSFRGRQRGMRSLIRRPVRRVSGSFDTVCLFSGGLDSFVGAIDLLESGRDAIFVSHYKDASTKSQEVCAARLSKQYGDFARRNVRANVSFDKNDLPGLGTETTTRGRSFIFFALAALAADAIEGETPIHVPENGLISLNVPLDPLRLGAWSTRTTHPFYMARWQGLLDNLGIGAKLHNPYRFKTKGEMLSECMNGTFIAESYDATVSCSSITKGRWKKLPPGHCGYCTPCLIRRASIEAAFGKDVTEYSVPNLHARALDATKAEATEVRAFQMMHRRLGMDPNLARLLIYKPGPLDDYSAIETSEYAEVFKRGIAEVGTFVNTVRIS